MRFTKSQYSSIDILSDGMKTPRTPATPMTQNFPISVSAHSRLTQLNSGNNGNNHVAVIETKIPWRGKLIPHTEWQKTLIVQQYLIVFTLQWRQFDPHCYELFKDNCVDN